MGLKTVEEVVEFLEEKMPVAAKSWKEASRVVASRSHTHPLILQAIGLYYNSVKNKRAMEYMEDHRIEIEKLLRKVVNHKTFVLLILDERKTK